MGDGFGPVPPLILGGMVEAPHRLPVGRQRGTRWLTLTAPLTQGSADLAKT